MSAGQAFGKRAINLPQLGLGTAPLGNMYEDLPDRQAIATIEYALSHGINFIDTAPHYGAGLAERRLGEALAGVPRESFVLATKVGRLVDSGHSVFDFSRDGILRSFAASLERLKLDRIDILHLHDPDDHYEQALHEAYPVLADLRRQGVIKAVGVGMNQWQMLANFAQAADFDGFLLAGRYTLLEQTALDSFLPRCQKKNLGIILGGVFNSGILATGPQVHAKYNYADAPSDVREKVGWIAAVCERHGVELQAAALQFALAHPAVTSAVIGAVTLAELEANLAARHVAIPAQLWQDLRNQELLHPAAPVPNSLT